MTQPIISMENVSKLFGSHEVLRGITMSVKKGEVVCIIGPSGSGKSTLLRCVNLLERPTGGRILFSSHDTREIPLAKLHARIGMVFQQFNLFSNLTVLQNCVVGQRKVLGRSQEEAEDKAAFFLERVNMLPFRDARPQQISGGQKQRAAIARALCMEPEVLLFDEPTSALDPEMVDEVLSVIASLKGALTMMIVTHEMAFAGDAADRVVFMDDGLLVEDAPPAQLFKDPQNARTRAFLARTMRGLNF
ncbi:MAG: amino acid ABC transporter ATP-binding protein [Eubacteriales bacterium]|jgi:putative lysine transport system ATP-binding protein|nr:amino acid ABC transporter ATP-binding protein [Eubacteriales bacterium]MDD4105053.1 amino acid ABC transporter ATP-binding protein [Eubacteriales bacterium]MDD4709912.1 amino acid ABC transporter ATP-binding protein [Eubacteriales bacterium]NLO15310.1 amino acid ABC transporter ATP-binding protein [Clostridiales bacterium]